MTSAELPPLFAKPASDAPWYVVPILTFVLGFAVAAAMLMPVVAGPDYTRGHSAGYQIGLEDGQRMKPAGEYDQGWQDGFKHGKASRD